MNDNGLSAADVALLTGNGNNNNDGFGGGWGSMIWLFALLALMGGWGNGRGFGGGGNDGGSSNGGGATLGYDFPWLMNGQQGINNNVSDGFRDAQLHDSITSVRDGISSLSTQLCGCCGDMQMSLANGFSGTNMAITGAQNAIAQQLYANQISNLDRSFAAQTANTQGMNAIQSQLAQYSSDNRLATNDLKYTIATENCADRAALSDGIRDILAAQVAGFQSIKDELFRDRLDEKDDTIAQLRQEVLFARGQASQIAQNQQVIDGIYDRLNTCPVGTTPVYGRTPIFTCNNNGCGCNNGLNL